MVFSLEMEWACKNNNIYFRRTTNEFILFKKIKNKTQTPQAIKVCLFAHLFVSILIQVHYYQFFFRSHIYIKKNLIQKSSFTFFCCSICLLDFFSSFRFSIFAIETRKKKCKMIKATGILVSLIILYILLSYLSVYLHLTDA